MYKIGDIIEGTVTGIQTYGVFISLDEEQQGLIHISECTHGYIQNVHDFLKVGEKIRAMVIDVDEYTKKISLSLRALEKVPIPKQVVKRKRRRQSYANQIGFESLRQKMPKWIEEAQELIDSDKNR
ncbi:MULTISPECIES: CvfD/Ygs/GSP13 family RNA-binding post-transcriptional regulator [unclassified Granulicatella]|uniref:CvfD/Ygs/GSP13 family RNA-binding post-transcriptional regulator n=1 Tax=unclassified Granulicatella TaxID=2630493 RepID=UPI0010749C13|nr:MULTISPECIES: CvfD/Ygs/GSP13 family RNA-binding post-transcriptional regulator [unclassified Granulicatella]MBF0781048.1 S1 RNA-binding domain-containing protein [Granulicatella sp. 19428wC4_WM01]TFU92438.1 S1 RNA-binding domain-containing protein [Granulicatella sp. WM01]